jgi:hypothetical protein
MLPPERVGAHYRYQESQCVKKTQLEVGNVHTGEVVARNPCHDLCFHITELFHECPRMFLDVLNVL